MGKINVCMIGGGIGSLIGSAHRLGAKESGCFELVAGVFSTNHSRTEMLARRIGIDSDRCYLHWASMIDSESERFDGARAVIIATPDEQHYEQAKYALNRNMHVICDKPVTITSDEAREIRDIAKKRELLCAVTYTQSGHPAFQALKKIVASEMLGNIRMIRGSLFANWAMTDIENNTTHPMYKQAWRLKKEYGLAGAVSDIGSHIFHYMHDIAGIRPSSLMADLNVMVPKRTSDDTANVLFRYDDYQGNIGVTGTLCVSLAMNCSNEKLSIEILGDSGGAKVYKNKISDSFELVINLEGEVKVQQFIDDYGFAIEYEKQGIESSVLEMFSNIYTDFGNAIARNKVLDYSSYPSIQQGYEGMVFIEQALMSNHSKSWKQLEYK